MNYLEIFRLVQTFGPELAALVKELRKRFPGDDDAVRAELRHITDHGTRGEAAEAGFDERVAEARRRQAELERKGQS